MFPGGRESALGTNGLTENKFSTARAYVKNGGHTCDMNKKGYNLLNIVVF